MTREYSRIFLKVILVLENRTKVQFWTSKQIFNFSSPHFGPQCLKLLSHSPKLDLDVHIWRSHSVLNVPQCQFLAVPQRIKWTSMSVSGGPTAY